MNPEKERVREYARCHVLRAAALWKESLCNFGFFASLSSVVMASLGRIVSLLQPGLLKPITKLGKVGRKSRDMHLGYDEGLEDFLGIAK